MGKLDDALAHESDPVYVELRDEVGRLRGENETMRRTKSDAQRVANDLRSQYAKLEERYDLLTAIDEAVVTDPPDWTRRTNVDQDWHGIATGVLSDLHFDEVVEPSQVEFSNAYNRKIAADRLKRWTEKFMSIARDHLGQLTYDGAAIFLNGDIFSGNIHEELKITNEVPIMASIDWWVDPMVAALRAIATEFGNLYIIGRVGNHGRNTLRPVAKNRVQDNFDWLFYRILSREMSDDNVTWDLPLSAGKTVELYDYRIHATHGDSGINGGKGISGILHPISLADFRARKAFSQMDVTLDDGIQRNYDLMVVGHFHTYLTLSGIVVNGSLKGYDEYAYQNKYGFEVPQQAFWVTTPEHGPSFHVGIQVMDREQEGW